MKALNVLKYKAERVRFSQFLYIFLVEYFYTSVIHGYLLISGEFPRKYRRNICLTIVGGFIVYTVYVMIGVYLDFLNSPVVTSILPTLFPISEVPFPTVAFCSGNRLSKKKLLDLSQEFYSHHNINSGNNTVQEIVNYLMAYSNFVNFEYDLSHFKKANHTKFINSALRKLIKSYSTNEILRQISPNCNDLLHRCFISDVEKNCSAIFHRRITFMGHCCAFNFQRPKAEELRKLYASNEKYPEEDPIFFDNPKNILTVVLNEDEMDLTHRMFRSNGYRILVFPSQDFPDYWSGTVNDLAIAYNKFTDIKISVKAYLSTPDLEITTPEIRNCYFEGEYDVLLKGFYSQSECMLHCRIENVYQECGCVPPTMPTLKNQSCCSLRSLKCLKNWKEKWLTMNYFTEIDNEMLYIPVLDPCRRCLQMCNMYQFDLKYSVLTLKEPESKLYEQGILKNIIKRNTTAIVNLSFHSKYYRQFEQSIQTNWIGLLGNFGGVGSLIFGLSLIGIPELIYFLTGKFFILYYISFKHRKKNFNNLQ